MLLQQTIAANTEKIWNVVRPDKPTPVEIKTGRTTLSAPYGIWALLRKSFDDLLLPETDTLEYIVFPDVTIRNDDPKEPMSLDIELELLYQKSLSWNPLVSRSLSGRSASNVQLK